jgi:hypothetical protein
VVERNKNNIDPYTIRNTFFFCIPVEFHHVKKSAQERFMASKKKKKKRFSALESELEAGLFIIIINVT